MVGGAKVLVMEWAWSIREEIIKLEDALKPRPINWTLPDDMHVIPPKVPAGE